MEYTERQYFIDTKIEPGMNDKEHCLSLDGYSGVKSVEIGIFKYHTTGGTTIEVPIRTIKWRRYTFR